ncbi:MAG: GDSL-type esterase/lipase family protein [Pirellulales bacterium]
MTADSLSFARRAISLCCLASMLVVAAAACAIPAVHAGEALKTGERIVFLGDSITQAGAGPGGFVTLIRESLAKDHADLKAEVIGAGISGNRVPDLQGRLDRDVIAKKPTLVVIYIGINDVWHWQNNRGTKKEDFESGLKDVIKRIEGAGARVVICTPSMIGEKPDGSNRFDAMLDEYSDISRAVAKEAGLDVIDLRKAFVEHLKQHNADNKEKGVLTSDGVHLNAAGNQFVAATMLAALGVGAKTAADASSNAADKSGKLLRHVVMFKFKDTSSKEDVQKVVEAFGQLPSKVKEIQAYEWGTDNSPEGKSQGFTHCFFVTFKTEKDRDAYLPHEAHQAFIKIAGPHIDKVLVVDYWTGE